MTRAIRGRINDPTANIALARCYRQGLTKPQIPIKKIVREVKGENGSVWKIWVRHTHIDKITGILWWEWKNQRPDLTFIRYLQVEGIVYQVHRIK